MSKYFLIGCANVDNYDPKTGDLVFSSKTMIEDSIAASVSNKEIRAGYGNTLQYIYYYGAKFEITQEDAQFSLPLLAKTFGSSVTTGATAYTTETVILGDSGVGSVQKTPLTPPDNTELYGWAIVTGKQIGRAHV